MCGIIGVFGTDDSLKNTILGLHALQHRGQEGIGVAWTDGQKIYCEKRLGYVSEFAKTFKLTQSPISVGHLRYSTTGKSEKNNLQPIVVNGIDLKIAICHNGNLTNFFSLRKSLEEEGAVFTSEMDTEVIAHLIMKAKGDIISRLKFALSKVKGAFSLIIMTPSALIAVRDSLGFRPLCLGRLKNAYVVASETCALDIIGAEFIREIEQGEILLISKEGIKSEMLEKPKIKRECIFELIYFARPDSHIFSRDVWLVRKELGKMLAIEQPADADIVIPVPDSGLFAAIGYSEQSGIPFSYGLVRSHYIGRTFIEPSSQERASDVRIKLNPIKSVIKGKRIVLIDDSIVRGTTSRKIVKMLKEAGAKEIHMRISSPPIKFPCYYGIDTPSKGELIASSHSVEQIKNFIGCDSLGYLSVEGMLKVVGDFYENGGFCTACFTGNYPIPPEDAEFISQLRLFRDY
ncbi:Amidophosphoribosyltransferase [bacterium HR19]|nr:Amidophosphoribosyltransferase [bacterium HR19]